MSELWRNDTALNAVMGKIALNYEVLSYLGGGGLSSVYKVRHNLLCEFRALKIMDINYILKIFEKKNVENINQKFEEIKDRFIREAKIYKKISHPNIIQMYDIDVVDVEYEGEKVGIPYLIMEYVEGMTLKEILKEKTPLDLKTIFKISGDILSALTDIHKKNVIHRDIKPRNIMIEKESGKALLIDFGLAKEVLGEKELTDSGIIIGSPAYMSPEQFKSPKDLDLTTDIYSFGIVLYEMLTGKPLFESENPAEVMFCHFHEPVPNVRDKNPDLPVGVDDIIFKALAKESEQRYKSAREFWKALNLVEETQKMSSIKEKKEEYKGERKEAEKINGITIKNKNFIIYALLITVIAAIVTFIVFDPLGIIPGRDNGKINYAEKIEEMKGDFERLKTFFKGEVSNKEKLGNCQKFFG